MVNSAVLKLVIDEQRCTKVKLQPNFCWLTRSDSCQKTLPCLGCLAHGKNQQCDLCKAECQLSCIVEAQRWRAGHREREREGRDKQKKESRGRETVYTNALQTFCLLATLTEI